MSDPVDPEVPKKVFAGGLSNWNTQSEEEKDAWLDSFLDALGIPKDANNDDESK